MARQLLACTKLKDLEEMNVFREIFSNHLNYLFPKNDKANNFVEPLTNLPTYPILLLWTLIAMAEFTISTVIIFSGLALSAMIPIAIITYLSINKNQEKSRTKLMESIILLQAKLYLMKSCIEEQDISKTGFDQYLISVNNQAWKSVKKSRLEHLSNGIESGSMVLFTLFGTYYLGLVSIIKVLGAVALTSALSSPAGLIIALGVCVVAGVYFGINQYHCSRELKYCKKLESLHQKELISKHDEFEQEFNKQFIKDKSTRRPSKGGRNVLHSENKNTSKKSQGDAKLTIKPNALRKQGLFRFHYRNRKSNHNHSNHQVSQPGI